MTTYKEIKVPNQEPGEDIVVEVSLEDVTPEPKETVIEEHNDEVVQQDTPKKVDKKDDFGYQKKASRSEKRIKQLHSEKSELQRQLMAERQARLEMEKQYNSGTKVSKEDQQKELQTQMVLIQQQMKDAMTNGETDTVVALQDKYFDAKMKYTSIDAELKNWKEVKEQPVQQVEQPSVPEKALDWIEDHPQFKTDELFYAAAIITNNKLVKEGFDPNSDEFYAEIDKRLAPKFPEVFGKKRKTVASKVQDDVQYREIEDDDGEHFDDQLDDESNDEPNDEPQQHNERKRPAVSPSSRGTPNAPSKGKSDKVVLSPADQERAERWGLSVGQMAKRMLHQQKNKRDDGYVPIFIDNK